MKTLYGSAFKTSAIIVSLLLIWIITYSVPCTAWASEIDVNSKAATNETDAEVVEANLQDELNDSEQDANNASDKDAYTQDGVDDQFISMDISITVASTSEATIEQRSEAQPDKPITLQEDSSSSMVAQGAPSAPLADGDYVIRANTATQSVLDVAGGSSRSGANAQLYAYNGTAAQKWHLAYNATTGLYTITNLIANMALDVSGASTRNGANVQVFKPNGTAAQQWRITKNGTGWRIQSALKTDFVLDISGGSSSNGANAQGYSANGTAAQRFDFLALKPQVSVSTATTTEGSYTVTAGTGRIVDVSGGSRNNAANVQQYTSNNTYAQRFYLEPDGAGYYRVFNVGSGLALDVSNAGIMPGTNVQQYTWNGTNAQLWSLQSNGDGTCTFISKANGLALDVSGGSTANGANLQVWIPNGTKAQKFKLNSIELLSTGATTMYSAAAITRVLDVKNASDQASAALQLHNANGSLAQRLLVTKQGSAYTLRPICSGLYVASSGTSVIQSSASTSWTATFSKTGARRGIVLSNTSNQALTASGTTNASPLKLTTASKTINQAFCPSFTDLIGTGIYTIASTSGGRVLDVSDGSWKNGANIQLYASNGTGAQSFKIEPVGSGYYRITNALTGKALDVSNANNADGTNVQQYASNGTGAQLWKPELVADGSIVFTNKATSKVLNVADGKNVNGANVNIWSKSTAKASGWRVKASSYKPDTVLQSAYNLVQERGSSTRYFITVDRNNARVVVFEGSKGNWTPIQNWQAGVGASSSPTPAGDYLVSGRGYSFDGALGGTPYTCYYWTNFLDNVYLFHSVPYHQGTWNVQDNRLGSRISHGCVRLATENAKWIYDVIPNGTHVYIYN